jgi:hypothetical protein
MCRHYTQKKGEGQTGSAEIGHTGVLLSALRKGRRTHQLQRPRKRKPGRLRLRGDLFADSAELRVAGINESIDFALEMLGYHDRGWIAPFPRTAKFIDKIFKILQLLLSNGRCERTRHATGHTTSGRIQSVVL